jgi:hypothetical protein
MRGFGGQETGLAEGRKFYSGFPSTAGIGVEIKIPREVTNGFPKKS